MPPCKAVLKNKIRRINYVTSMWKNANQADPTCTLKPEDNDWVKEGNDYRINWYNFEQISREIGDILQDQPLKDDEDEDVAFNKRMYGPDNDDDDEN